MRVLLQMSQQASDIYIFTLHIQLTNTDIPAGKHLCSPSEAVFSISARISAYRHPCVIFTVYNNNLCVFDDCGLSAGISSTGSVGRAAGACSLMIWPQASLQLSVNTTREECVRMETDAGQLLTEARFC